ncbi:MAG TPA: patatin-like phospholipase family protein [Polyangia bacterium]|nr:patatin-like phospholipase family protein [Polyangia bacterium]
MSAPSQPRRRGDRPRVALVLSGGGARGAYEAGVLRYLREDLAGDLGGQVQFDIISGTSVGGIHACFVAGTADMAARQGRMLCDRWESFVLEEMVTFGVKDFLRAPATLLGSGKIEEFEDGQRRLGGIVQTQQLERVVRRLIPWGRIGTNLAQGHFESLSVTATDIGSGKSVVYVQRAGGGIPEWSKDPFVRAQAVTIGPEHALASAALPILFPAVAVGERFFCDGGLRQNTPLSPALRLGADKVLVIGLRHKPPPNDNNVPEESMPFPGAAFLVGKILDAFLLDHIDYDLDRLRRFNALIRAVHAVGSVEHSRRFDEVVASMRGAPYRIVEEFMIRPSADLGEIAGRIARAGRFKGSGGGPGIQLLRRLATARGADEADLLSYILFDGLYAAEVTRLGYEDARAQHHELARFLGDSVVRE